MRSVHVKLVKTYATARETAALKQDDFTLSLRQIAANLDPKIESLAVQANDSAFTSPASQVAEMLSCIIELKEDLEEIEAVSGPLDASQTAMEVLVFNPERLEDTKVSRARAGEQLR